jgi:hypothetical protein
MAGPSLPGMEPDGSGEVDAPLIVQLPVEKLKDPSILGLYAESPSARNAPGLFDDDDG